MHSPSVHVLARLEKHATTAIRPFYIYDTDLIRELCRSFLAIPYKPVAVHFATMANAHEQFLRVVREEGLKVFVNSRPHLRRSLELGFGSSDIVFTSSALDDRSMLAIHDAGARVNLDSVGQVERWREICPGAPFGLRCNVGERIRPRPSRAGWFVGPGSRLGLDMAELASLAGSRDVDTLHLYAGTDITDLSYFQECYEALRDLVPLFPKLQALDLGGGFGVSGPEDGPEPFDFDGWGEIVRRVMAEANVHAGRRLRLILEPGRIIGAEAGLFACSVTDVKKRGERQLVGVAASSAQFPRPLFYPETARHPVAVLRAGSLGNVPAEGFWEPEPESILTDVFGCSTYSRDYLARSTRLGRIRPGDLLVFGLAGAYCASSRTDFLGFEPAEEIFA